MTDTPDYLFLKQSATLQSYFGELCLDVPMAKRVAVVISEIGPAQIGSIFFQVAPKYNRSSRCSRLYSWIVYCIYAARVSFSMKGRPLLFIVAQPPFLPLIGFLQKKWMGRKYVVWIDDIYPDVLVRKKVLTSNSWIVKVWSAFNRMVLENADHVFTLGPHMLDVVRKYITPGFPVTVIPTWVDTDLLHPVPRSSNLWAKCHGLEGKFTIMYSGNFGETHDVDLLLAAARRLHERSDLHFVLIGAGSKWEGVRASVEERHDANITVLPWQPAEILSETLSSADVSYVSLATGIEGVSMPSKTYYAMAVGSVILASCAEQSDLAEVVKTSRCGLVVRPNEVEDIVKACEHLSSHPLETAEYKRNGRSAAVERYSRRVNARLVRETVERILGGEGETSETQTNAPIGVL
jgi:glycosyltransferase involved in cell wall biosynthesis